MNHTPTILQVLPKLHQTGGVERGTVEVASAIVHHGWKAVVASAPGELCTSLARLGVTHIPCPLDTKNPWKIWRNARRLQRIIREHKVDIVHARSRAPAWSAWLACKRTGTIFITTFHGQYNIQNEWKRRYNAIMLRGRRVIAVSNFIKAHIIANYQVDERRIHVIHRGVDLAQFHPDKINRPSMAKLIEQWNLPAHLPIILFPGRITRWKGQDVFIQALAKLPHRNFFAVLVGDDTQHPQFRDEVEQLITQSNLEGHVRMVGSTPYMAETYQLSKLVVATSIEPEAFGRVAIEAQSMGKPVIATNHGGACETVAPGETGWLVEPGSIPELASAMEHALGLNEDALQQIGQNGMARATTFSTKQMCDKVLAVYAGLLGGA